MNTIELREKASQLKTQRELHIQRETFNELSGTVGTIVPISLATLPSDITKHAKRLTEENLELAKATNENVSQLTSIIAGQAAELAQLRQAVLVLAQSAKNVEDGIQPIATGINQVIENTKIKIRPFSDIKKEMSRAWNEIIEESLFVNDGHVVLTVGRGLRSLLSLGTAAPEAWRTAKREVHTHVKLVRSLRDKIENLYNYALLHHSAELAEWIEFPHPKLTADKQSWSIKDTFAMDFVTVYLRTLYDMRKIPN
jgi:hypothetical protein